MEHANIIACLDKISLSIAELIAGRSPRRIHTPAFDPQQGICNNVVDFVYSYDLGIDPPSIVYGVIRRILRATLSYWDQSKHSGYLSYPIKDPTGNQDSYKFYLKEQRAHTLWENPDRLDLLWWLSEVGIHEFPKEYTILSYMPSAGQRGELHEFLTRLYDQWMRGGRLVGGICVELQDMGMSRELRLPLLNLCSRSPKFSGMTAFPVTGDNRKHPIAQFLKAKEDDTLWDTNTAYGAARVVMLRHLIRVTDPRFDADE